MNEKEMQILETIKNAMTNMSEYDKGYLLGYSEGRVREKRTQELKTEHIVKECEKSKLSRQYG